MDRYINSLDLMTRTRKVTPGGAQTNSKRSNRFPEGAYPLYLESGEGASVIDVDGNSYVDWICGLGAVPLGYNNEEINQAIIYQLEKGLISSSLPTALEEEVASKLVSIIPCAADTGQVRFTKTGSEACSGAIRIARRYTKRLNVIVIGYHGWHDWVMQTANHHPGVPEDGTVFRVNYNDLDAISTLMKTRSFAAVMLEPTLLTPPIKGYLSDVVTLCDLHGALCIFDEMVTGFRWSRAGGQEYFNVTPHLSVFGKGLANGMPLACIIGPERIMKYADVVSGTFGGECLSLAAASAILGIYSIPFSVVQGGPYYIETQWNNGQAFLNYCAEFNIPVTGYPVHPKILYDSPDMEIFLQETALNGILLHPSGFNVSAVLTEKDMRVTKRALEKGAIAVQERKELKGKLITPGIFVRNT